MISNCHKRELKWKRFLFRNWIFKNLELWFLSQYVKRYIKLGQSFFNFSAWKFCCEDLFAKQIFQDYIYNYGNSLLTLLPITSFIFSKAIAFRNTIKMPTEMLCLQLWISQFFHDIKCSNLAYFRNVKTWTSLFFFS